MMTASLPRAHEPDVFLSSTFRNFMEFREEIRALDTARIWAVEKERPDLDTRKGVPAFYIVDTLIERIRKSSVFICVLRDRYGSSVFEDTESVSLFETEIYQAALYHNNVHFFLLEPFNPSDKLKGLLDVVRAIRPNVIPDRPQSKQAVLDAIERILDDTRAMKQRSWAISLRRLVGELALRRGHPKPDIEFFDGVFRSPASNPNKDHVQFLLHDLSKEPGIERRLTRMWIALRELSAAPYDRKEFSEYLPFWDSALGAWASAAAWYGLHGHLYAGRLAAVNSLLKIRAAMDWSEASHDAGHYIHGTKGGRASEYYSMAKLLPARGARNLYLSLALTDVEKAIDSVSGDVSGYLAIRGHVYRMQGRLQEALKDFNAMIELRERKGDEGGLGEARSDLGLIQMKLGNFREGWMNLRDGAEMLETAGRYTFAIRARKRLAYAHLRSFHPVLALKEVCAAYDKAQEHEVYGQITPLMEWIHHLSCGLGIWSHKDTN